MLALTRVTVGFSGFPPEWGLTVLACKRFLIYFPEALGQPFNRLSGLKLIRESEKYPTEAITIAQSTVVLTTAVITRYPG